jgi:hypothetical protein
MRQSRNSSAAISTEPPAASIASSTAQALALLRLAMLLGLGRGGLQREVLDAVRVFEIADAQGVLVGGIALLQLGADRAQRRRVGLVVQLHHLALGRQRLAQLAGLFGHPTLDAQQIGQLAVQARGMGLGHRGGHHGAGLVQLPQLGVGAGDMGAREQRIADAAAGQFLRQRGLRQGQRLARSPQLQIGATEVVAHHHRQLGSTQRDEMLARALVHGGRLGMTLEQEQRDAQIVLGIGHAPAVAQRTVGRFGLAADGHRHDPVLAQGVGVAELEFHPRGKLGIGHVLHLVRRLHRLADTVADPVGDVVPGAQEARRRRGQRVGPAGTQPLEAREGVGKRGIVIDVDGGSAHPPQQRVLRILVAGRRGLEQLLADRRDRPLRIDHHAAAHGVVVERQVRVQHRRGRHRRDQHGDLPTFAACPVHGHPTPARCDRAYKDRTKPVTMTGCRSAPTASSRPSCSRPWPASPTNRSACCANSWARAWPCRR